ncbi:MAG: hypothetical protein IPJ30_04635 [Acidobacteria bacterium]|nr:hypothetical protein [Acidobacteriota bacterium]
MFRTETPLWFYILAEAETKGERVDKEFHRLGPLGSVVVCETIIGLLQISPFSILAEPLGESEDDQTVFGTASVGFGEVLELIQNVNADFQKTLYPEINYSFDDLYPEREKTTK